MEIKFTDEELKQIKEIKNSYESYSRAIGTLEIEAIALKIKKEGIESKIVFLQKEEIDLAENLSKKYGDGVLNPDTGIFTPNK